MVNLIMLVMSGMEKNRRPAYEQSNGTIQLRRLEPGNSTTMGTSYGGGTVPLSNVVKVSDLILVHGNGVSDPNRIREMVREARQLPWVSQNANSL